VNKTQKNTMQDSNRTVSPVRQRNRLMNNPVRSMSIIHQSSKETAGAQRYGL